MTKIDTSYPIKTAPSEMPKPQITFGSYLAETLYCRLPSRPKGYHEDDLVVVVAHCEMSKPRGVDNKAWLREDAVRKAIHTLLEQGLLERYQREGEWYLRRSEGVRSIVLRFI